MNEDDVMQLSSTQRGSLVVANQSRYREHAPHRD